MKITVLYYPDDITLLYSLYPLLAGGQAREFDFTSDPERALRSESKVIILFRFYKRLGSMDAIDYLLRLRQRYERVVYFDDTADPREVRTEFLGLVDLYYKKQLLADRSLYRREAYGKRLFTQYYHERYGEVDCDPAIMRPMTGAETSRLRLSWNLGIGSYPKSRIRRTIAERLAGAGLAPQIKFTYANPLTHRTRRKTILKASARFGCSFDRRTVARHRELFDAAAAARPDLFLRGHVPLAVYNRELLDCAATVSPFGWGEICFRDFEAIINRSLLLKPSMDHVETWPDVYRHGETYVPLSWDAEDLAEKTEMYLSDTARREAVADRALEVYAEGFRGIEERVRQFMDEVAHGGSS